MLKRKDTDNHPVYTMPFSKIYQCYIDKAEKKVVRKMRWIKLLCG